MRNILLIHPSIAGKDADFWPQWRRHLATKGYRLCILSGNSAADTENDFKAILSLFRYSLTSNFDPSIQEITKRLKNFGQKKSVNKKQVASLIQLIQLYIHLIRPSHIFIWGMHRAGHYAYEQVFDKFQLPVSVIERSPFPNTLYCSSNRALMADSSLRQDLERALPSVSVPQEWQDTLSKLVGTTTWWESNSTSKNTTESFSDIFLEQLEFDTQSLYFSPFFSSNQAAFNAIRAQEPNIKGIPHPKSKIKQKGDAWLSPAPFHDRLFSAKKVAGVNSSGLFEAASIGKPTLSMGQTLLSGLDCFYEWNIDFDDWKTAKGLERKQTNFARCAYWLFHNGLINTSESDRTKNTCLQSIEDWTEHVLKQSIPYDAYETDDWHKTSMHGTRSLHTLLQPSFFKIIWRRLKR